MDGEAGWWTTSGNIGLARVMGVGRQQHVVPTAVRQISHDESDIEPHDYVTWVEKYKTQDLWKIQLEDEITDQIIRWLEDYHIPSQAE